MGNAFEGFETWYNGLLMTAKMYLVVLVMFVVAHLILTVSVSFLLLPPRSLSTCWTWGLAYSLWPGARLTYTNADGSTVATTAAVILSSVPLKAYVVAVFAKIKTIFFYCSVVYLFYFFIIAKYKKRSTEQSAKKYVRGAKKMDVEEYLATAKEKKDKLDLPFGEIKMPVAAETEHCFIIGRPSTGKTNLCCQLLERIKERGDRAVVYDFKSDYLTKFYDPKEDLIFNPLDSRSLGWNLFNEIETFMDVDAITSSLIPPSISSSDPFWNDAARDVLAGIMHFLYKSDHKTNKWIWELVTADGSIINQNLKSIPEGQRGYRYIEDASSKQALSVFSVMMQYAKCFEFMASNDGDFTLQNWLDSGKGMIFITNYSSVQDTLRPILSLFIDLLSRKLLSMPDSRDRKIFFLLDEFGTLQRLSSIIRLLTLSRSKGGSVFIAIQDYGQIDRLYSKDHRQSIINACGTAVAFSMADPVSAEISSSKLGEIEYLETETTHSMGVNTYRDGISLSERKKREKLFMPSELMDLEKLTAVVKFSDYDPVLSKFDYKKYRNVAEAFAMRKELILGSEPSTSEENFETSTIETLEEI